MSKNQITEKLTLDTKHFDAEIQKVIKQINELKAKSDKTNFNFNTKVFDVLNGKIGQSAKSFVDLIGKVKTFKGGLIAVGAVFATFAANAVKEAVPVAMAAEGIRNAFARIGTESFLDKLREQTRGLITDVELMKQAVKFKNFNLPLEQLGTYLAFAQRQAKETGESMDFLVDSIVNGLGRGSVQILDNLGISAKEIKERMKEGGDMTEVVAQIIKEKMAEAGEDIETLSEKAKRSETDRQNALEKLGSTWAPLTQVAKSFWTSVVTWAYKAVNVIGKVINAIFGLKAAMNGNHEAFKTVNENIANASQAKTKKDRDRLLGITIGKLEHENRELEYIIKNFDHAGGAQFHRLKKVSDAIERLGFGGEFKFNNMTVTKDELIDYQKEVQKKLESTKNMYALPFDVELKPTVDDGKTSTKTTKINKENEKIFNEQAETIEEIDDNIEILNKKLKKTKPNTEAFKKLNADLKYWKGKKVEIELSISDNSRSGISQRLSNLRRELDETEVGSEKYIEIVRKIIAEEEKLRKVDYDMNKTFMRESQNNSNKILSNVIGIYDGITKSLSPLGIFNNKLKETVGILGGKTFNQELSEDVKGKINELEEKEKGLINYLQSTDYNARQRADKERGEVYMYTGEEIIRRKEVYEELDKLRKEKAVLEREYNNLTEDKGLTTLLDDYTSTIQTKIDGYTQGKLNTIAKFKEYRDKLQELVENGFIGEIDANWEVLSMNDNILKYTRELYKNRYIEELKEKGIEIGADFEVDDDKLNEFIKEQVRRGKEIHIPLIPEISPLSISSKIVKGIQDAKGNLLDEAERLGGQLEEYLLRGLIDYDTYKAEMSKIIEKLNTANLPPIKIKTKFEFDYEKFAMNAEDIAGGIYAIDGVISSFDEMITKLNEGATAWEVFMSTVQTAMSIIQAVGTVMQTVAAIKDLFAAKTLAAAAAEQTAAAASATAAVTTTVAKKGEAVAETTAQASKLKFPMNLIAIAAGIAAVIGAFAMIGSFANGGVVGGSQYAGDALLARVNSGEMILNGSQQKKLFDMIDGGKALGTQSGQVQFVIKGKDLVGVSRNYNDKLSRIK